MTPARRITDRPRRAGIAWLALLLLLSGVIVFAVGLLEAL